MTAATSKKKQPGKVEGKEITFKCTLCGNVKPLSDMRIVTRFFPPIVACLDCEKKMS